MSVNRNVKVFLLFNSSHLNSLAKSWFFKNSYNTIYIYKKLTYLIIYVIVFRNSYCNWFIQFYFIFIKVFSLFFFGWLVLWTLHMYIWNLRFILRFIHKPFNFPFFFILMLICLTSSYIIIYVLRSIYNFLNFTLVISLPLNSVKKSMPCTWPWNKKYCSIYCINSQDNTLTLVQIFIVFFFYRTDSVEDNPRENRDDPAGMLGAETSPLGAWPHGFSSMLACLGCTIGIFNISRFAIFSIHFGGKLFYIYTICMYLSFIILMVCFYFLANFIVQFLFLSLIIGIPLFTLHLCLGQLLCSGPVDMWKISPLFQGVGIALLIAQSLIGIYSIIGISWLFVYFRDSFITKMDRYRWAEPYGMYRDGKSSNRSIENHFTQWYNLICVLYYRRCGCTQWFV